MKDKLYSLPLTGDDSKQPSDDSYCVWEKPQSPAFGASENFVHSAPLLREERFRAPGWDGGSVVHVNSQPSDFRITALAT